jgi:hypothetical protein
MKLLGLIFCLLFTCGLALGQSWLLYSSDTEVVNGDGSVTITPTVLLWGDDGGSCSELDGQVGYDTPAVVLNGNAWVEGMTVLAGGVEGNGGIVEVSYTFPNVTLPGNGTAVDLSFGGKVQQACGTQSTFWGNWPDGWGVFFTSSFLDGYLPNIPPGPCNMLLNGCTTPWPSLYKDVPQHVVNRDIDSQQVGKKGKTLTLVASNCLDNPVTHFTNELVGSWALADGSCSQNDEYYFIPPEATCNLDSTGRHCYTWTSTEGGKQCSMRDCPGRTRVSAVEEGYCAGWLDSFPIEETKTCMQ